MALNDTSKSETLDFMDAIRKQERRKNAFNDIGSLPEIKARKLEDTKNKAVTMCLDNILQKVYTNAIPCDIACKNPSEVKDLDVELRNYIAKRTGGNDSQYYVKEGLKKTKNPALKRLLESVESIIRDMYFEKTIHPETITDEDLGFKITPEVEDKLDDIIRSNNLDDLSEKIKTNVKSATRAEIDSAKKEKEERQEMEDDFAKDESIKTESDLSTALMSKGYYSNDVKVYNPSLFAGILMNKFTKISESSNIPELNKSINFYTEGLFSGISDYFKAKAEADAKRTIAQNSVGLKRWLDGVYRRAYSRYRSEIAIIDFDKMIKGYKSAINDAGSKINIGITLGDVARIKEERAAQDKVNLYVLEHPTNKPDTDQCAMRKISRTFPDACNDILKYVKELEEYFKKTKLDTFIDKYCKLAYKYADKCVSSKEVENVYNAVVYIALNEINNLHALMFNVGLFQRISKDIIYNITGAALKESALTEAVKELTLITMSNALHLESFSPYDLEQLGKDYARGKID